MELVQGWGAWVLRFSQVPLAFPCGAKGRTTACKTWCLYCSLSWIHLGFFAISEHHLDLEIYDCIWDSYIKSPKENNIIKICLNIVACQYSEPDPLWGSLSPLWKEITRTENIMVTAALTWDFPLSDGQKNEKGEIPHWGVQLYLALCLPNCLFLTTPGSHFGGRCLNPSRLIS